MTTLTFPTPAIDAMNEERRDGAQPGRRDADRELVQHVRAADTGISMMWRWAQIGTTIICFGFTLGVIYTKFGVTERAITELRTDVRATSALYVALDKQTDRHKLELEQKTKDIEALTQQVVELRSMVNSMRSMREAYVYNSAMRGVKPSVPP